MPNPMIRFATLADYPHYTRLFNEINDYHAAAQPDVFRHAETAPRSLEEYQALLADPTQAIFIAEVGGEAAAYLHLLLREQAPLPILVPRRFAVVDTVVVDRRFQRQGIGRALMEQAEVWARQQGASAVQLNVWDFNTPAREMYAALGYEPVIHRLQKKVAD